MSLCYLLEVAITYCAYLIFLRYNRRFTVLYSKYLLRLVPVVQYLDTIHDWWLIDWILWTGGRIDGNGNVNHHFQILCVCGSVMPATPPTVFYISYYYFPSFFYLLLLVVRQLSVACQHHDIYSNFCGMRNIFTWMNECHTLCILNFPSSLFLLSSRSKDNVEYEDVMSVIIASMSLQSTVVSSRRKICPCQPMCHAMPFFTSFYDYISWPINNNIFTRLTKS